MDTIHYLHQCPELIPESQHVSGDIYWGGNFETVKLLIKTESIDLNKIKFFIGYSGWESGQLENELSEKTWLVTTTTSSLVFSTPFENIWKEGLKHLGGKFELMINFPIDPQLN